MANKLKISKSDRVISVTTIGASAATGNRRCILTVAAGGLTTPVSVVNNVFTGPGPLQVGSSFEVATSQNGLTAGTTYFVGEVVSDTEFVPFRFSPSRVYPAAGTTSPSYVGGGSPVTTSGTGLTVATTVNQVGTGYPSDTPQDMGVVGGYTGQQGKQLLADVAIAVAQPGKFWFSTASNDVYGDKDADFTTNVSAGEQLSFKGDNIPFTVGALVVGVQYVINNTVGTTAAQWITMGAKGANLGEVFIATAVGAGTGTVSYASDGANVPLGTVNALAVVQTPTASSDAGTDLITVTATAAFDLNAPIYFGANIGGLTAGTTYFVKTIDSGTTFSVSATLGGTALALTTTTVVSTANIEKLDLDAVATFTLNENASILGSNDEAGYILRQKGKRKYLVSNGAGTRTGICTLVKKAKADLLAGEMSVEGTYSNAATTYVKSISDVNGRAFTDSSGSDFTPEDQSGMQATFETIAGTPLAGSVKPVLLLPSA